MLKELNLKTSGFEPSKNRLRFPLAKKKVAYNALSLRESMKTAGLLILALLEVTLMKPSKLKMMDRL